MGWCLRPGGHSPPVQASLRPSVLPEIAAMPCRHRSLRIIAPLVARAQGDRPYGTADTTCLRDSISKQGARYPRSLFVIGALAVIRYAKIHGTKHRPWLTASLARKLAKVAAISLANKIARMVWAMMTRGERYKEPVALAA
jgi:transposase